MSTGIRDAKMVQQSSGVGSWRPELSTSVARTSSAVFDLTVIVKGLMSRPEGLELSALGAGGLYSSKRSCEVILRGA